jgi:hypothetical protein
MFTVKTCSIFFLLQWLKRISAFVFVFGLKGLKIILKNYLKLLAAGLVSVSNGWCSYLVG